MLTENVSTDENYPLKDKTTVIEKKLKKLDTKHGPLSKNFVEGECSNSKKIKKANVGHLSNKKLNDNLKNNEDKTELERKNNIKRQSGD